MARPDTSTGADARLRHYGQIGTGGCTSRPQSEQPWMRSLPSAPERQNHSVAGVNSGRGLMPSFYLMELALVEGATDRTSIGVDVNVKTNCKTNSAVRAVKPAAELDGGHG